MIGVRVLLSLLIVVAVGCGRTSPCERASCWTRRATSGCGGCLSDAQGSGGVCRSVRDAVGDGVSASAINGLSACLRACEDLGSSATCSSGNAFCACLDRCQQAAPLALQYAHEDYMGCVVDQCDSQCR